MPEGDEDRDPLDEEDDDLDVERPSGDEPNGVEEVGVDGRLSSSGVEGVDVPDEVPRSCSKEYSIPLTFANSR